MTDTLKSICEQCTHLNNPQLDFIPAELERCREILVRDLRELASVATAENEKSVVVLAGSILEGVLHGFIKGQRAYITDRQGRAFELDPSHGLKNYVNIYNRWLKGLTGTPALPDAVVDYRNLVHISRELDSPPGICGTASREMLRVLDSLLGALSELTLAWNPK